MTSLESARLAFYSVMKKDQWLVYALEWVGRLSKSLKPKQKACMNFSFDGRNVFVCLLTQFGKSVSYKVVLFKFDE